MSNLQFWNIMGGTKLLSVPIEPFDETGLARSFSGTTTEAKFLEVSNTNGAVAGVVDSINYPLEDQNASSVAIYSTNIFLYRMVFKYIVPENINSTMYFKITTEQSQTLFNNPTGQYIYSIPNYTPAGLTLSDFFQLSTIVSDTANATPFVQVGANWECKIPITPSFIASLNAGGTFSLLSVCKADRDDIYSFTGTPIIDGTSGRIDIVFS